MIEEITLTFDDGESLSNEYVDCSQGYEKAIAIFFASGYNTTNCSFQAYDADGNNAPLYDTSGSEIELTIDQTNGTMHPLDPTAFAGVAKFKVRRGTLSAPFSTGAENSVIKVMKRIY